LENINYRVAEPNFRNATLQHQKLSRYYGLHVRQNQHVSEYRTASMLALTWLNSPEVFE
jgi:hypothetical protein